MFWPRGVIKNKLWGGKDLFADSPEGPLLESDRVWGPLSGAGGQSQSKNTLISMKNIVKKADSWFKEEKLT